MKRIIALCLIIAMIISMSVYADENTAVTRETAVQILTQVLPVWEDGEPFADATNDKAAAYYRKKKVVSAISDNNFMPKREVTTEEFLIMLKRALDVACPDIFYDNTKIIWHTDQNEISPLYRTQIAFLSTVGVYNNSGYIHPKSIISEGMAQYYTSLAVNAQNYARRSRNGQKSFKKIPMLMYHIIETPSGPYPYVYVSVSNFADQIKYLYENGYTFLFPEEISLANTVEKPVIITFDDGYIETYKNAYNILRQYNAKATLYMISDKIGEEYYCNERQLFEMSDSGVFRIYSHTKTHPRLSTLTADEIAEEFAMTNDRIADITGREVTSVAYPYGAINQTVISQAKRFYKNGFSVVDKGSSSNFEYTRTTIDDSISILRFPMFLK